MKIMCVLCCKPVGEMDAVELLAFILWLRVNGSAPVCFSCSDNTVGHLLALLQPEVKALSEKKRVMAGDVF